MRLTKFFQAVVVLTLLSLIYIHMQIEIYDVAYAAKRREKELTEVSEYNAMVGYDILSLKSSNHLGVKLLSGDSSLKFRDNQSIVQLVTAQPVSEAQGTAQEVKTSKMHALLSFLSLQAQAEARAAEKVQSIKPWQRIR